MIDAKVQRKIVKWLASDETGISSETMAFWLGWSVRRSHPDHPYDPADFNRCLGLLAAVPALREELWRMRKISVAWTRLVRDWAKIEDSFLREVGINWNKGNSAPITYGLMKESVNE